MRSAIVALALTAVTTMAALPVAHASEYPATEVKPGVVYACLTSKTGWMRVPKQKVLDDKTVVQCRRTEELRFWSMIGQTGQPGSNGATGATGPQGPAGPVGPGGPAGPAGPQGPAGATGADGSDAIPGITYSYRTGASDTTAISTNPASYTDVLGLTNLDGYYLVSYTLRVASGATGDMYCMLVGGSINNAFLLADRVNNPTRIIGSAPGTISGTFPVQVTGNTTIKCLTTGSGSISERMIAATKIAPPSFQNWPL